MLKVTFKNVGQGDSILLEWETDSVPRIGIIDCNLNGKDNVVIDHLKLKSYSEIEFIILSHPHYDHFSGIRQLLEYCEANKIRIKKFLHTSQQVPDYLRVATRSIISENELILLFKKIQDLHTRQIIEFQTYVSDEVKDLVLNKDLRLSFLAPSSVEHLMFLKNTPLFDEEDPHNNTQSNWLTTIIKVYTSEWYILLTSDISVATLKRVGIQRKTEFAGKLRLGQSPHHGSKMNHYDAFWKTKSHDNQTPIVFSVGDNIYNHPSKVAIDFFSESKNNFEIYSTNQVGALKLFVANKESRTIEAYLDAAGIKKDSTPLIDSQYQGDQIFSF